MLDEDSRPPIRMLLNAHTALSTSRVLLVPYSTHHVATYHEWMQDPDLQSATASEPLSLAEEHSMQRSWREDCDKLTFIICLPPSHTRPAEQGIQGGRDDGPDRMVGDINLFLFDHDDDDEEEGDEAAATEPKAKVVGEIELMIARKDFHRRGYGRASLLAFLDYVLRHWESIAREYDTEPAKASELAYLRARIHQSNSRSIALFESIGFRALREGANYFGEVELRWRDHRVDLERCKGWETSTIARYQDVTSTG